MKTFKFTISCLILSFFFFGINSANAEIKEFTKKFKNGQAFQISKKIPGISKAFVVTTNYDNGKTMKTEEWRFGKRNGITKVYNKNGSILKEIKFKDNYVLDYKAYKNGKIETQISEDRRTFVNKGKVVNVRWNKYYELWGGNFLVAFDSKALINYLLNFVIPEEATEILSDITDFFDKAPGAGQNGKDDIMTCGGNSNVFKDNNVNLSQASTKSGTTGRFGSATSSKTSSASSTVFDILNSCAQNYRNSSGGTGGLNNNQSRNNDISNANSSLDNMISGCRSRSAGNRNLISADPTTLFKSLQVVQAIEAEAAATQIVNLSGSAFTESASAVTEVTLRNTALQAMEGSAIESAAAGAARGFTTLAVSNAIVGVVAAAVTGWTIGTAINNSVVGKAITEAVASVQEANDPEYQAAVQAAAEAQQAAEARAEAKKKEEASNPPESSSPGVSIPSPDGTGAGDPCERAQRFKAYCNATNWKDMRCEEYIRMIKGCVGDIREIYVSPEGGSVMDVGCPGGGDPARVRELECKRRGMFVLSGGGDAGGICANKKVEPVMGGPDQRVINPTRGDFSNLLSKGMSNVSMVDDSQAGSLLSSSKPTLVIFADPDCGYCNDMTNALTSKSVSTALKGFDVKIVDVNMNPRLAQDFGINTIPAYFVAKSGKKSTTNAGALDEKGLNSYLNDNKNGPTK